jgi:hypothetical protein
VLRYSQAVALCVRATLWQHKTSALALKRIYSLSALLVADRPEQYPSNN